MFLVKLKSTEANRANRNEFLSYGNEKRNPICQEVLRVYLPPYLCVQ